MDVRTGHKRKRRSGKSEAKITEERVLTKSSPPRVSATKLIRNVNKTQKLYEKHSSNQNITFRRMTIRPGIFNRGKCTSFVHRVNLSPEKKARIDADLHRIIQLANDPLAPHHSSENLRKEADESTASDRQLNKPEKTMRCEGNKNRDYLSLDENMESKESELNPSLPGNSYESLCCKRGEEKKVCMSRTNFHKLLQNTSSSSSSSHKSVDVMQSEVINYSDPPMEVYEEFADFIISALHTKRKSLFPDRDYLLEARCAMKSKFSFSQPHFKTFEDQSGTSWREKTTEKKGNDDISDVSHNSNLSASQEKSYLSAVCDNWNPFNSPFDINNTNICTSGIASQNLIYKHSNRSYIDSPQAVEFKEAKFLAPQPQQQLDNPLGSLAGNNIVTVRHSMSQKVISDMEVNRKNLGYEYLMNVSALPRGSGDYDCFDLLDDLDASDCNLITDKKVICVSSTEQKTALNKHWCPPPSPDTAEHKFYRRKMF